MSSDGALATGHAWEWQGDSTWHLYSLSAMDLLEQAHASGQVRDLASWSYMCGYIVSTLFQHLCTKEYGGFSCTLKTRHPSPRELSDDHRWCLAVASASASSNFKGSDAQRPSGDFSF